MLEEGICHFMLKNECILQNMKTLKYEKTGGKHERKTYFVEKKPEFAVLAHDLKEEIASYLGIDTITDVRVLIRYDIEDVSEDAYQKALITIFSEPPVDFVYEEAFPSKEGDTIFSVEFLPGQFDQRADSAEQCVKLLNEEENPVIRSATTYVISGTLTAEQIEGIKSLCINPVDSRENNNAKPETLVTVFEQPEDVRFSMASAVMARQS